VQENSERLFYPDSQRKKNQRSDILVDFKYSKNIKQYNRQPKTISSTYLDTGWDRQGKDTRLRKATDDGLRRGQKKRTLSMKVKQLTLGKSVRFHVLHVMSLAENVA
jgi:hypothetical protein